MSQHLANEYFIEKHRMPVTLLLADGTRIAGEVFTQASWRGLAGLEDAAEFMNADEPFFPFGARDGRTRLVAKAQVLALETATVNIDETRRQVGEPTAVAVALAGGIELRGHLRLEQIVAGARLLDYLNHLPERFVPLYSGDTVTLVNRAHVVFVVQESARNGHDAT